MLENTHLPKSDIKIYQALVGLGEAKSGAIIEMAGVVSSGAYAALQRLIKQGLVSVSVKNNVRYYRPEPPLQLISSLREQISELDEVTEQVEQSINRQNAKNRVVVYEGGRGFKQGFLQHIDRNATGTELHIIEFGRAYRAEHTTRDFFTKQVAVQVAKKKFKVKMILDNTLHPALRKDLAKTLHIEFRVLPSRYFSAVGVNVSDSEVMLSILGVQPIAICLRDQEIVGGFQRYFALLWAISKHV